METVLNILVLTLHDLRDYPLGKWIDCARNRIFVLADEETQRLGCSDFPDYSVEYFPNYINNGLVEKRALELHRSYGIHRIVSFGEDDVIRAARLRATLGLPGQDVASAEAYRCKVTMKARLAAS